MNSRHTPAQAGVRNIPGNGFMHMVNAHRLLWGSYFTEAWESTPIDAKFAWLFAVNNTIAIITLIEIFVLKKA